MTVNSLDAERFLTKAENRVDNCPLDFSFHRLYTYNYSNTIRKELLIAVKGQAVNEYNDPSKAQRLNECFKTVVTDTFNLEHIVACYQKNPEKVAENCYRIIKENYQMLKDAAQELNLSTETLKSWHRKGKHFRSPKLENVLMIAFVTQTPINELLN